MSLRSWALQIWNINEAVSSILDFVKDIDYAEFKEDFKTNAAVAYSFMIITEAARNVPDELKAQHPELPWSSMLGMPNFITHGYWSVDTERLWTAIKEDLPPLLAPLTKIVQDSNTDPNTTS